MKLSINKNQGAVIVTLMVLIFLGAVYFFLYLPKNESRIQEQRFKTLRDIDKNVHTKIENSVALLSNLLTAYQDTTATGKDSLRSYVSSYSTKNFILVPPSVHVKSSADSLERDSAYRITVNDDTREISLVFTKLRTRPAFKDTLVYRMDMKFSFTQFIVYLLPQEVFDEYIIFSKGETVHESFPAGISYVVQDSLLNAANGIGSSGIKDQQISGVDYKMFLQPVGFDAKNEWIVAGLLTADHYKHEKTELPGQLIMLLATIMLMALLALPWLRLYQMGSKERLTISDGVFSIFISMLLVSIMFFLFFNYSKPFAPKNNKKSAATLAANIRAALLAEINAVYQQLENYDATVSLDSENKVNLNPHPTPVPAPVATMSTGKHAVSVNEVFWLDSTGYEIINWTAGPLNAPPGKYTNRQYFNRVLQKREYLLNQDTSKPYFLEQVISWTSGTFRSVLSKKSKLTRPNTSRVVAALSFNLQSLGKIVLPGGFLFAITDDKGNVLYHSEPKRNLHENLFHVFSQTDRLKSYLSAGVGGRLSTRYFGHEYDVEVLPVEAPPYYVLVFENAEFVENMDIQTYGFTFGMMFIFVGFISIQLFAIFLVSARRSFFKKQLMDTSWIGPRKSSAREYLLSATFNSIIIVLLMLLFGQVSLLLYFFMLCISVTCIPLFLNISFARRYRGEKRVVARFKRLAKLCIYAFIAVIAFSAFRILQLANFLVLVVYVLVLIAIGEMLYRNRNKVIGLSRKLGASRPFGLLMGRWSYVNSFGLMTLTRLIITSGIPVAFFYVSANNYEHHIGVRYNQVDFAERLLEQHPSIANSDTGRLIPAPAGVYPDGKYINEISIVSRYAALNEAGNQEHNPEEKAATHLLSFFRLYRSDIAVGEENLNTCRAGNSGIFFNQLFKQSIKRNEGAITYVQTQLPHRFLKLKSRPLNFNYPSVFKSNRFNGGLFWILLLASIAIFYFIVTNIVKKLFAFNLPDLETWKQLDYEILVNKDSQQPVFVIGLPGAGKKKYLLDKIKSGEITTESGEHYVYGDEDATRNNVFIAELIKIPSSGDQPADLEAWAVYTREIFAEQNKLIIVNHFEYNIHDAVSNHYKLEFLERLYLESKSKIIILSTIHPVAFLDSAMEHVSRTDERNVPGHELERWHVLLGHYRIVVLPLQLAATQNFEGVLSGSVIDRYTQKPVADVLVSIMGTTFETTSASDGRFMLPAHVLPFRLLLSLHGYHSREVMIKSVEALEGLIFEEGPSSKWAKLIRGETNHSYFLTQLQTPAFEAGKQLSERRKEEKFDELAFKMQVSSHYFYMYIWQSLTREEKFLLYDLAEDNLVNAFDDYNLSMLIAKGLIIRPDGTLRLFNKGFRNFILSAIGNAEAMKIKQQIRENGNWGAMKYPIQLVIIAILGFLLTSQEEAFAKLITYAAALGAGVPAVLKLFSLFDKSSTKPA